MNGYTTANGTSLSTPLIGGASGVVLSAHPGWTPMMVREALMMTADRVNDPDNIYGWGTVNVMKAILYHPEGDVVFDYIPLYYASPDAGIDISSDITCTDGVNSSSVTLYWNDDGSETFNSIPMDVSGDTYSAEIPARELGDSLWYYIYAESNNGLAETYPIGAPNNNFIVEVSTPKFSDNFEQGPYYWETEGENAKWGLNST
ncbi:MAG: S8 family peptidase, partial [candidate division Zixibacteria bacterium]|nr:S8 family peptidase [candidate division Zixibacteria bacterium]